MTPGPGGATVEAVDVAARELPLSLPFPTSYGETTTDHLFVRVRAGDDAGHGEGASLRNFTGETASTMAEVADAHLRPAVAGESVDGALAALAELRARFPGHPAAFVAFEMALFDLKARRAGLPFGDLFGRRRRETVPTVAVVGAVDPGTAAETTREALAAGHRRFKLKADGDPAGDAERVNAVTDVLASAGDPDELSVRVDANTGWRTAERARRALSAFDRPAYVEYVEQPTAAGVTDDLRELRRAGHTVFADESATDLAAVRSLVATPRAVSGVCAKLAKFGSVRAFATAGAVAADAGLPVTPVSAFDTSVGAAAVLHLAAVAPRLSAAAELLPDIVGDDPAATPLAVGPETAVPDGPGLGVRFAEGTFD